MTLERKSFNSSKFTLQFYSKSSVSKFIRVQQFLTLSDGSQRKPHLILESFDCISDHHDLSGPFLVLQSIKDGPRIHPYRRSRQHGGWSGQKSKWRAGSWHEDLPDFSRPNWIFCNNSTRVTEIQTIWSRFWVCEGSENCILFPGILRRKLEDLRPSSSPMRLFSFFLFCLNLNVDEWLLSDQISQTLIIFEAASV